MAYFPNNNEFLACDIFVKVNDSEVILVIHTRDRTAITIYRTNLKVLGTLLLLTLV